MSSTLSTEWYCASCSFLNHPALQECEICSSSRKELPSDQIDSYCNPYSPASTAASAHCLTAQSQQQIRPRLITLPNSPASAASNNSTVNMSLALSGYPPSGYPPKLRVCHSRWIEGFRKSIYESLSCLLDRLVLLLVQWFPEIVYSFIHQKCY